MKEKQQKKLKQIERAKKDELNREKMEFFTNISHELKTPLTSISGYAEIMESGIVKEEDMLNFAGIIHTEALRLIHLVEDIIKISRLDDNQVELEKEEVCLLDIVSENIPLSSGTCTETKNLCYLIRL